MDIQKFIQDNVPNVEAREEFEKFLYVKDKLFGEAMDNWLKKRGSK